MEKLIKVITPAGAIYVDSIQKAKELKHLYDFPYVVERTEHPKNSEPHACQVGQLMEYSFWMIWCMTYEGDERWHMGRFPLDTDSETACDIVRSRLTGGVGGDAAEVLRAEYGYDDGIWTDYCDEG